MNEDDEVYHKFLAEIKINVLVNRQNTKSFMSINQIVEFST